MGFIIPAPEAGKCTAMHLGAVVVAWRDVGMGADCTHQVHYKAGKALVEMENEVAARARIPASASAIEAKIDI